MSTYYTFAAVCGSVIGICAIAWLVIESIRLHRIQINKELREQNLKLWAENTVIRAKHADIACELSVHTETIKRLVRENEALEQENRMLMSGTPVSTIRGMRIAKASKE
jgi:uncharacterized membrane protein YcjF (UPF0283 family)